MQRRRLMFLLAGVSAAALFGCAKHESAAVASSASELRPLTVDEVSARIAAHDGKTFVYDDNPKESWTHGHVPGATWLDEEHVTAADLPTDKTATLIFYCHNET